MRSLPRPRRVCRSDPSEQERGTADHLRCRQDCAGETIQFPLGQVAAEKGVPQAQVALAWVMQHPSVSSTIVGATKLKHLEDAIAALDISLIASEKTRLEEPYLPHVWQTPY
jgi:1-deoxyxylulose-5-phosphate synthase